MEVSRLFATLCNDTHDPMKHFRRGTDCGNLAYRPPPPAPEARTPLGERSRPVLSPYSSAPAWRATLQVTITARPYYRRNGS